MRVEVKRTIHIAPAYDFHRAYESCLLVDRAFDHFVEASLTSIRIVDEHFQTKFPILGDVRKRLEIRHPALLNAVWRDTYSHTKVGFRLNFRKQPLVVRPWRAFQRKSNRPIHENLFAQRGKKSRSLNLPLTDYQDLPRLEAPAGYVYVIQDVSHSNQYKIGRINHPARRLNKFDVVLPIDTKIIALLRSDDAAGLENRLHRRYRNDQTRGEWFDLTLHQIDEIRSL